MSFDKQIVNTPDYLQRDSMYHGGVAPQISVGSDSVVRAGGWTARRWDPAVQARWWRLIDTLARAFDGRIEGIVLPETALDVGPDPGRWPAGFTPERYRDAVVENMAALKRAFPQSVAMQYGNFMPGEWLPANDHGYLKSVYAAAARLGVRYVFWSTEEPFYSRDVLPYLATEAAEAAP